MDMSMYAKHNVEWEKKVAGQYVQRTICPNYRNTQNNTILGNWLLYMEEIFLKISQNTHDLREKRCGMQKYKENSNCISNILFLSLKMQTMQTKEIQKMELEGRLSLTINIKHFFIVWML